MKQVAGAYVDDTDVMYEDQKDQANETSNRICAKLKNIAHTWERLIYGSGGELFQDKTYWWFVWWQWDREKATMAIKNDTPITLDLTIGKETIPKPLKRKDLYESIAQLGVKNNPTEILSDEHIKHVKHSNTVTNRLNHSSISSKNAYHLHQNIWLPSCQYPLVVTTFSKQN
eukprot:445021-Ditylum_brightwellii.AAC.1